MPEPFQPRFVDLVRNLTITTGTGNFVLGAAVSGFSSFSPAIAAGESFYYSAIGIDKPAEREVGRGTMQANGSIAREPISGGLTNFTPGAKSIALIAAAEWFNGVQAGSGSGGGGGSGAATRTALAALPSQVLPVVLSEAGREGIFVFDGSNLSTKVGADPAQGIYVALSTAPGGASGAWVRKFSGAVNVKWFGAKGDGVTNDGASFSAALTLLKNLATSGFGYGKGSSRLYIPAGVYILGTTTLDLTHTMIIEGDSSADAGGLATVLKWSANTTGIRVQTHNTTGATAVRTSDPLDRGDASIIRNIALFGSYTNFASEGNYHGIHLRGRAIIRECYISNFQGDGINSIAVAGGGAPNEGNANNITIDKVWIDNCRSGIFFDGADTNAGTVNSANCNHNRQWGICDSSFLGNTYIGCHVSENGVTVGATPTAVSHGGNRYYLKAGQAAGAATNAPTGAATDNDWWGHMEAGGPTTAIPAWTNGIVVREGGAYRTDNPSARNVIVGCYSEGGQAASQFSPPTLILGGLHAAGTAGYGGFLQTYFNGALWAAGGVRVDAGLEVGAAASIAGAMTVSGAATFNGPSFFTNFASAGASSSFGPQAGAATDNNLYLDNTNFWNTLNFRSWNGGVPQTDAIVGGRRGTGIYLDGYPQITLRAAASDIGLLTSSGLAITGTVAATGAVTGSNLLGTNSGDQTIALTGDVTGSGEGSFAATIGANKVTFAKFVAASAASMVGATAAGNFAELTPASARTVLGLATIATSGSGGDLTGSSVTYAKVQNVSATSKLLGRATAGAGVIEELGLANGLAMAGGNLDLGSITPSSVVTAGALTSSGGAGNGYSAGAGGTVTQSPNKSSGVTLNKICGRVTMNNASLAANASVSFTLTNSTIAATDVVVANIASAGAANSYLVTVDAVAAGSCRIQVRNISAGALSEALLINFAVMKSVIA